MHIMTTPEPHPDTMTAEHATPTFAQWLDTYVEEKGLDTDQMLRVHGPSGPNFIPLSMVLDALKQTGPKTRATIKTKLVAVDFINGNPLHFFRYAAAGLAL